MPAASSRRPTSTGRPASTRTSLTGTATATSYLLITGKQIKNGSIGFEDLSASAKQSLHGQRGAPGVNGTNGQPGPQGQAGPQGARLSKGDRIHSFGMSASCITPDSFEPNDSEAAAAQIATFYDGGVGGTIDHPGDGDWLLLPLKTLNYLTFSNDTGLGNPDDFKVDLYRDGALFATGKPDGSLFYSPSPPMGRTTGRCT